MFEWRVQWLEQCVSAEALTAPGDEGVRASKLATAPISCNLAVMASPRPDTGGGEKV